MSRAAASLATSGLRKTSFRVELLAYLRAHGRPVSAEDIARRFPRIDRTTVFRTMKTCLRAGLVRRIDLSRRRAYYESAELPHHHHLICTSCDRVDDITLPQELSGAERHIRMQKRFHVTHHSLEFFGLCRSCH